MSRPSAHASPPRAGVHGSWPSRREDGLWDGGTYRAGWADDEPSVLRRLDRNPPLAANCSGSSAPTRAAPRSPARSRACARTCAGITTASRTSRVRSNPASTAARSRTRPTSVRTARTSPRRCWQASSPTAGGTAGTRTARAGLVLPFHDLRAARGCGRGSRRPGDRTRSQQRARRARSTCSSGASSDAARPARSSTRVSPCRRSRRAGTTTSCVRSTTSALARPERDERCAEAVELHPREAAPVRAVEARAHPPGPDAVLDGG